MKGWWLMALVIAGTACHTARAAARFDRELPPVPVVRFSSGASAFSSYSGLNDSLRTVVRDSTAWRALWQRIQQPFFPRRAVPAVDFRHDVVVVAALGKQPSAGYDVVIDGAEQTSDGLVVDLRITSPAPGCPVEAAITQPVDLGRVPITDMPVHFRERRVVVGCDMR